MQPSASSSSRRRERESTRKVATNVPNSTSAPYRPSTASNANPTSYSYRNDRVRQTNGKSSSRQGGSTTNKPVEASVSERVDVSKLSQDLTKMVFQATNPNFVVKRNNNMDLHQSQSHGKTESSNGNGSKKANTNTALNDAQTLQIKKILAECLQNFESSVCSSEESMGKRPSYTSDPVRKSGHHSSIKPSETLPFAPISTPDSLGKTSLLRSYLSGSNPTREEYVSKRKNVSNSLISSDSIHHSIFLESGRERRQCLLQYLSNVVGEGQVVIYVNSIPGVESLVNFLTKHGFQVNAVHQRMLMAESNWILSEFSQKKFSVLLCAEDHYHSCPAHFRWVKTIINYELPICNPLENWSIRNGIVEFSDSLPVHIYTFIKKSCALDNELVKLLRLDSVDQEEEIVPSMTEQVYSL